MKNIFGIPLVLFVGILLVGGVGATIIYKFGQIEQNVTVDQAVLLTGGNCNENECTETETVAGGETANSETYMLESKTSVNAVVDLETTITPNDGPSTVHYGILTLAQKNVAFGSEHWTLLDDGATATVKYTISGDSFEAEVTSSDKGFLVSLDGYVLIYYKDNSDRFNDPARARTLDEVRSSGKDLPYPTDGNTDEYNYCVIEGYDTCYGAKIWYVPEDAIIANNELDWNRASEFLYEKEELIQYNSDGVVTIYPKSELDFYVATTFGIGNIGTYTIVTKAQI